MKLFNFTKTILIAGIFLLIIGCNDDGGGKTSTDSGKVNSYSYTTVYEWNELYLKIERYAAGYRPGPAPTSLAYMGFAAYEACAPGFSEYQSVINNFPDIQLPKFDESVSYHWPTVASSVFAYMMPRFFVDQPNEHQVWMNQLKLKLENEGKASVSNEEYQRSFQRGVKVAEAFWNYFTTDKIAYNHYKDPFQGYVWQDHFKRDGDWKPTPPGPDKPMGGVYGGCRTFVLQGDAEKTARKPLTYSTEKNSPYYGQAYETWTRNGSNEAAEDQWVAEFWSDDLLNQTFSPGPRWIAIGDQVLKNENSNLETALAMNAKVGISLHEAAVACWYSKYKYNVERPVTFIKKNIDPNWDSGLMYIEKNWISFTPPFPAYPSGHSTMGAAGAEALGSIFGYSYAMTDYCHQGRSEFNGTPRSFGSFFEMAQENAWSRVPLGVHWRMDSEEGVRFGTEIGRKVNARLAWKK